MSEYRMTIESEPNEEDVKVLSQGLTAHALPYVGVPGFQPVAVFLRDDSDAIAAGIWGNVNWNWLHVGLVWVSEDLRGKGYGEQLIGEFERLGRERGCLYAHLDTFSYQARPFYERLGYKVFAELEDYPPGHKRFYMKKKLADSSH